MEALPSLNLVLKDSSEHDKVWVECLPARNAFIQVYTILFNVYESMSISELNISKNVNTHEKQTCIFLFDVYPGVQGKNQGVTLDASLSF